MVHKNGETFNLKSSTNKRTSRQLHNACNELRPSLKDIVRMNIEENFLLASTIAAVTLGISSGFIIRSLYEFNDNETKYFGFIGQIFLRMLKFLILPLIAFSLISGIAGLGSKNAGKIAVRALVFYFSTTFIAVIIGIVLVSIIRPGVGRSQSIEAHIIQIPIDTSKKVTTTDTILDLIRNLFPDNIVEIAFREYETVLTPEYHWMISYKNGSNLTALNLPKSFQNTTDGIAVQQIKYYKATGGGRRSLNVLGLILFCFVFGGVLASMGKEAELLVKIFEVLNNASVRMIRLVMLISPFGIWSLIVATVLEMKNPKEVFERISMYFLTVILGLIVHGFLVLPGIYVLFTRRNVFTFAKNMFDALFIALSTASSTAALPQTFTCIEEKNKINKLISRFVIPVGATINMDGTALYEAVAVIFIAQLNDRNLSFVDLIVTSITATLASIGAASVPSAGLVTMLIVLNALNLPTNQISLIYVVDWFLDRLRTTVNVWGDSVGAGIIEHLSQKEIAQIEEDAQRNAEAAASMNLLASDQLISMDHGSFMMHDSSRMFNIQRNSSQV